jgi:CheY-like chemotaxis protein
MAVTGWQATILVIDDDPEMRELMARYLLGLGHLVVLAESAEEGLAQLPLYTFNVAFLDQHLPGMEGLVLGEYLQKNNPQIEIALVTGDASPRVGRLCREHQITLIEKPFDVDELRVRIEAAATREMKKHSDGSELVLSPHAPLVDHLQDLGGVFDMPNMPDRIQERLYHRIRESIDRMTLGHHLSPHDRSVAYAGLVSALVLGLRLPKSKSGESLYARYDRLMKDAGCDQAFGRLADTPST